jgi:uncharacterized protein YkwD
MRLMTAGVLVGLLLTSPARADAPKEGEKPKLSEDEQAVVDATNKERKAAGLPELKVDPALMKMAREHSATMARLKEIGHDLGGKTFQDRIKESKYPFRRIGENVAAGYDTPKAAVQGWMESQGHKENILNKEFSVIGVAVEKGEDGKKYWTQIFADPLPK